MMMMITNARVISDLLCNESGVRAAITITGPASHESRRTLITMMMMIMTMMMMTMMTMMTTIMLIMIITKRPQDFKYLIFV